MMHLGRLAAFLCYASLTLAAGCRQPMPPPGVTEYLRGTVTFLEKMAIPPEARVKVMLLDIDALDVPDFIVAFDEHALSIVPNAYSVAYDPHGIAPNTKYGIAAEIRVGDELLFESLAPIPVLTKGAPNQADLVLKRVTR